MTHNKPKGSQSLSTAIAFFVVVGLLIGASILFKIYGIYQKSIYDSSQQFSVAISTQVPKKSELVSVSADKKTVSVLKVMGESGKNELVKKLAIPIDATIQLNSKDDSFFTQNIDSQFFFSLLHFRNLKTNLTVIDLFRLFVITKTVSNQTITVKDITLPQDEVQIDKLVSSLFSDPLITNEKISIQISNATQVSGLGNKLSRVLSNMGANVVAISTADTPASSSAFSYADENSYTVKRLGNILQYKKQKMDKPGISDIIITIGKDYLSRFAF
jgi:hypothetical protein